MGMTVKITNFEDGVTGAGANFTKFNTSQGLMSAWDEKIIKTLKAQCGNDVDLDVQSSKDGKYKNIRGIFEVGAEQPLPTPTVNKNAVESNKQAGVAMRYAVELCIAGKIELEDIGTNAVALHQNMKDLAE